MRVRLLWPRTDGPVLLVVVGAAAAEQTVRDGAAKDAATEVERVKATLREQGAEEERKKERKYNEDRKDTMVSS